MVDWSTCANTNSCRLAKLSYGPGLLRFSFLSHRLISIPARMHPPLSARHRNATGMCGPCMHLACMSVRPGMRSAGCATSIPAACTLRACLSPTCLDAPGTAADRVYVWLLHVPWHFPGNTSDLRRVIQLEPANSRNTSVDHVSVLHTVAAAFDPVSCRGL